LFLVVIGIIGVVVAIKDPSRLQNFEPFLPRGWAALLVTMGFTYVAFEGFEVISQAGDEAVDPKRNLPKAMLYSVYIVTMTYVAVAFATIVAVKAGSPGVDGAPWEWIGSFRERGFGEAVARFMPAANLLLTLAVIFASTSALNATIYSATRASYALGRDRMLPAIWSKISRRRKTPWAALLLTGAIVICVALFLPTMDVASSASIMFLFLFFLVNISVIKIRRNMADELQYGYLMPLFPVFPIIAIICQIVLAVWLVHMSLIAWIVAPAWILSGVAIYRWYSRSRVLATEDEILILEEEEEAVSDQYKILVAVANPDNALSLVRNTYKLCDAKNGQVELLHMVPVPDQVPLSAAGDYMLEGKEAILEIMLYLTTSFPVSTTIRYCRNVARGVISVIRQKKADMLIMGWRGKRRPSVFRLGSTVDPIIERSPSSIVIMKDCGNKEFERVLVPVAGGPNSALALEVASILVEQDKGTVVALTVERGEGRFDIDEFVEEHAENLRLPSEQITTKTIQSSNVVEAILEEAKEYDLIVLGTTREPLLRRVTRETIPDIIARRCGNPLVMVKATGGLRSWIKRWL
jgi:nucleotide-binding universal stress UspA family protein